MMYYHEGIWYDLSTLKGLAGIIRDCIGDRLADFIENSPDIKATLDEESWCADCHVQEELQRYTELLGTAKEQLWLAQDKIISMEETLNACAPEPLPGCTKKTPARKMKAAVRIQARGHGEGPCQGYACPVCDAAGIHIGLTPPEDRVYSACPCCNVRLDWRDIGTGGEEYLPLF